MKRHKLYDAIKDEYDVSDFKSFTRYLLGEDLPEKDIDILFNEAEESYYKRAYSVAFEKFQILNNHNLLSAYGKKQLADCYFYLDRKEEALNMYYDIQNEIESDFSQYRVELYYQIGRCLAHYKDFDNAILYLEKVKILAEPWSFYQRDAIEMLTTVYNEKGDIFRSKRVVEEYIKQYLAFMEIKPTDCWDKLYVDEFLADLYFSRWCLSSNLSNDLEKYIIIAAAWGSKEAIETCKKLKINYSS